MDRKEAIREYKERKPQRGIFALRCEATGSVWIGSTQNLEAARNRYWFSLGQGMDRNTALQQEWNEQGEQAFHYEVLEKLKEDVSPLEIHDLLKEKKADWMARQNARPVV